jgi:hypothetical protein
LKAAERDVSGPEGRSFEPSRPTLNTFHCFVFSHAGRKYSGRRDIRLNRTAQKNGALKKFEDVREEGYWYVRATIGWIVVARRARNPTRLRLH